MEKVDLLQLMLDSEIDNVEEGLSAGTDEVENNRMAKKQNDQIQNNASTPKMKLTMAVSRVCV